MLVFSVILLSAVVVPGIYMNQAKAAIEDKQIGGFDQLFGMFDDPRNIGGALGSMMGGVGGNSILGDVMQLMFSQVMNFNDREILPGQNVFVFNATANSSTSQNITRGSYYDYWTSVPFQDLNGNSYYVHVHRDYDVEISFRQEAQVVLILWDNDGSLIAAIRRLLAVVQEAITYTEENPGSQGLPEELISKAVEAGTWILIHINDIITGDEQIIFQPSYYWSTTYYGNLTDTRDWFYANNGSSVNPATIPGLPTSGYVNDLAAPSVSITNKAVHDTGFMFHLFQLWLQRFQIHINMSKLSAMLPAPYGTGNGTIDPNALSNLLEGLDIKFAVTQHHLLSGMLYNDTNADGTPTVNYVDTGYHYTDSDGIVKNVTIPTTDEVLYKIDIDNPGIAGWTPTPPTVNGSGLYWSVQFNNPTLRLTPVGADFMEAMNAAVYPCDRLKFGFTFTPSFETVAIPDENGNPTSTVVRFGKGTIKLDQEFGAFTGLPPVIAALDLAVVYFSHVFTFDLSYTNLADASANVTHEYHNATGTLDFLNAADADYFANIDIAGPQYSSGGILYDSHTAIVPFAFFDFTFNAERTLANDNYSTSQGEPAFRTQTLYVGITSAWAFYCVSYPEWNGAELVHDPTFSIFMTLPSETPWGVILLVVVIGALVAGSIVLYFKKQGRF